MSTSMELGGRRRAGGAASVTFVDSSAA
eukprot:SAG11_NODE_25675_length_355_cov_1.402344_1_plen_27_part_10